MKISAPVISVIVLALMAASPTPSIDAVAAPADAPAPARVSSAAFPLEFLPDPGPAGGETRFYARTSGYTLRLTPKGMAFDSSLPGARNSTRCDFVGASSRTVLEAAEPSRHVVNIITGNDPSRWRTGVETSRAVLYKGLYEGINLRVYGVEREVEYDWIVAPGADPGRIRFAFGGHGSARVDAGGNLAVGTAFGDILHRKPVAYQVADGRRSAVAARFRETSPGVFGFEVGPYDRRAALVIDPVILLSSTYLGGRLDDGFCCVAVDKEGGIYAAGESASPNFPLKNARDAEVNGLIDAVLVKIAPDGKSLVFSTFLGGNGTDSVSEITLDREGNPVVCGATKSTNFPVVKAHDATANGGADAFVAKLDPSGRKLLYSSYFGGREDDFACGLHAMADGTLVVCGASSSPDFPVKRAFSRKNAGKRDAVLFKLSKDGKSLLFSTYYGGGGDDWAEALDVDAQGSPYVIGHTASSNLPVKDAFQLAYRGNGDVFLAKFAPGGGALVYATYFGGAGVDNAGDVRVDAKGAAYLAGDTDSNVFPLKNAWDKTRNGVTDAFVAQFAPTGERLVFSTYLGGRGYDHAKRVAIDGDGGAWVVGDTSSKDFPVRDAYNKGLSGGYDAFIARFAPGGRDLTFATYLGGSGDDRAASCAIGPEGALVCVGQTVSNNFPVKNAIDRTWNGESDGFVVRMKIPATAARRR